MLLAVVNFVLVPYRTTRLQSDFFTRNLVTRLHLEKTLGLGLKKYDSHVG